MRVAIEQAITKFEYWKSMYEREGSKDYAVIMSGVLRHLKEVLTDEDHNSRTSSTGGKDDAEK